MYIYNNNNNVQLIYGIGFFSFNIKWNNIFNFIYLKIVCKLINLFKLISEN